MARYHINTKTGNPGVCRAKTKCPFGDLEADHYGSKEEALSAYEQKMTSQSFPTSQRSVAATVDEEKFRAVVDDLEIEEIEHYANVSAESHAMVDRVIENRAAETVLKAAKLEALNPYENKQSGCDRATYRNLKKDFEEYKDRTAVLVEAHLASPHYRSPCEDVSGKYATLGRAVLGTGYEPNTREWLEARFNAVGGSDVGTLVVMDFMDEDKIMYWDRRAFDNVEQAKREMPSDEVIAAKMWSSFDSKSGALYRGTAWEDRSRDIYAKNNPNLKVLNIKDQFYNPDRPWQQVNFDGLTSDREDGAPNGILEFKTSNSMKKWDHGVPLNYRAQVLYYLNATGFEKATVIATVNDGEFKTFDIHRDDAVAPGKYNGTMEQYIQDRVEPWFNQLRSERKVAV